MRKVSIAIRISILLGGLALWVLSAQMRTARPVSTGAATTSVAMLQSTTPPSVGAPTLTPNLIVVGTSTQVLATVSIPEPNVTGVNLVRLLPNGSSTVVATMNDGGINGDQTAGDKVFTVRLTLNEPQAGEVKFQVSAAFRGVLRRSVSPAVPLAVWLHFSDQALGIEFSVPSNFRPTTRPIDGGGGNEIVLVRSNPVSPDLGVFASIESFTIPTDINNLHDVATMRLGPEAIISETSVLNGLLVVAKTMWSNHFFHYDPAKRRAIEITTGNSSFFQSATFAHILATLRY